MNGQGDSQIISEEQPCNATLDIIDPVEKKQSIEWLRQRWQFVAILRFLHKFSKTIGLQLVTADQLENAIVNSLSERTFSSELIYKLTSPSTTDPGQTEKPWELQLSERLQTVFGSKDAASKSFIEQSWFTMHLYAKVSSTLTRQYGVGGVRGRVN
jgi:hypothetical protein